MSVLGRFQVAVGAVIQHRGTGDILLIHRAASQYMGDIWEFPIGRTNQFETLRDGLKREVEEETGITELEIGVPFSAFEFMRGDAAAENEVRGIVFAAYTDQREIRISEEHDGYKWLPLDEAIEMAGKPGIKQDLMAFRGVVSAARPEAQA